MNPDHRYESPLGTRYASSEMQQLWGSRHRAILWRRIWLHLAQEQQRLGIDIPDSAIAEMENRIDSIDFEKIAEYERQFRHDVMAHIHAFGDAAPRARAYIHLGATSAFVTDNADLIVVRDALRIVLGRLRSVLLNLREFAALHRERPTVAYTHFQPAQLTTVGKRCTLWLHDLMLDALELRRVHDNLPCRGCKGTTGTQASFLDLFDGDHEKVRELDRRIARAMGFARSVPVSGQTYSRKIDSQVLDALSGLAQSAAKFANDMRLLQHEGELLEPFEKSQIGSSAMPYKRNPMRAERICALARHLITLRDNSAQTASHQWLERTLDDSANRRLTLPESFLAADAVLILAANIGGGIEVREESIRRNVERVMPFMATERWLMLGVRSGGDRQSLHEVIRRHSMEVHRAMEAGGPNDLVDRIGSDPAFAELSAEQLRQELHPSRYVGRAPEQTDEFLTEQIDPLIEELRPFTTEETALRV